MKSITISEKVDEKMSEKSSMAIEDLHWKSKGFRRQTYEIEIEQADSTRIRIYDYSKLR